MISITVRSPLPKGAIFYYEPATSIFTGTLIPNPEWVADDCITMQLEDRSLAVIPKRDIIFEPVDGAPFFNSIASIVPSASYQVKGSKGNLYTVTRTGKIWSCTCTGFQFRRDCKHVREAKGKEEGQK